MYLCTTEDYANNIYKVNKSGEIIKIFDSNNNGNIIDLEIVAENKFIINLLTSNKPQELYLVNEYLSSCLTTFNKDYSDNTNFCDVNVFCYKEIENNKLEGFVVYPSNFDKKEKSISFQYFDRDSNYFKPYFDKNISYYLFNMDDFLNIQW